MLELHVASVDASNGNIPVSWCVSKELMAKLAESGAKDPTIIICIVPQKNKGEDSDCNREYRKVAKLRDLMTYVELPFAGENKMYAMVSSLNLKDAKAKWLYTSGSGWYSQILNYDKDGYETRSIDSSYAADPITLEVPNAIFAKEPSDWEKAWIGWMNDAKPTNQCEFRKQRLFAYTLQPILFLGSYVLQIVFSILALLLGTKGFSFKPLLHPLSYDMEDKTVKLLSKGTVFINRDAQTPYQAFKRLPFMPPIMGFILFLIFGGHTVHMWLLGIVSVLLGAIAIASCVVYVLHRREMEEEKAIPWYLDAEEQQFLVCNGQQKPMTVGQLPSKHKTLGIRFQAFKAQVCRPFSR